MSLNHEAFQCSFYFEPIQDQPKFASEIRASIKEKETEFGEHIVLPFPQLWKNQLLGKQSEKTVSTAVLYKM